MDHHVLLRNPTFRGIWLKTQGLLTMSRWLFVCRHFYLFLYLFNSSMFCCWLSPFCWSTAVVSDWTAMSVCLVSFIRICFGHFSLVLIQQCYTAVVDWQIQCPCTRARLVLFSPLAAMVTLRLHGNLLMWQNQMWRPQTYPHVRWFWGWREQLV